MAQRLEKTVQKINETRGWLFRKKNETDKPLTRLITKKREYKEIKSEMKEKQQLISQKYKGLQEPLYTMNNYIPTNGTTWAK